ncbi:AcrR family transcriptional regulator [Kibdelosporangium banguiense]|uniref:AcrR family transcriptional regulator n=1 Tax=Kibdelosporangium banguiense TaxID=1365924 RepID=A0ABS4TT31_9PSEU|nr:TetR/AcrR family transcriptional regulator [Kibdelosporangium banguiense]MBP2327557.1 AcrR family transcriptional regulator [Kibdelosporangium banguiense]
MPNPAPRLGRPRDSQTDQAVLLAARELLAESGYSRVTMDATAARAGVGKAAIYRRFGSKAELLFAAAVHGMDIEPPADSGSLRSDLRAMAHVIHERLTTPAAREVIPAVLAEASRDPALAARFQSTFVAQERRDLEAIMERAWRRGELSRPVDPTLAHLLLGGPLFVALFVFPHPLDEDRLDDIASVIAAGLIAHTTGPPRSG